MGEHSEWFEYADPAVGDWDWRGLLGPVYLEVTQPQNPVMFGYGVILGFGRASTIRLGFRGSIPPMASRGMCMRSGTAQHDVEIFNQRVNMSSCNRWAVT